VRREFAHVAASPMPGDVVELVEQRQRLGAVSGGAAPPPGNLVELVEASQPGEDADVMLRVLAVVEEFIGYKEYGRGRFWVSLRGWQARLKSARVGKLIRPGDHDLPF
jgi:hypothetical protein